MRTPSRQRANVQSRADAAQAIVQINPCFKQPKNSRSMTAFWATGRSYKNNFPEPAIETFRLVQRAELEPEVHKLRTENEFLKRMRSTLNTKLKKPHPYLL